MILINVSEDLIVKVYKLDLANIDIKENNLALCLGFFDGIHIAHQRIISLAKNSKHQVGLISFENIKHEFKVIDNEITPLEDKIEILEKLGVDYFYYFEVDDKLIHTSKEEFIEILKKFHAYKFFCGSDFTFGYNAEGNAPYLKDNLPTEIIDLIKDNNIKISSRDIKNELLNGNIDRVNTLLGRPYCVNGIIKHGLHNGEKLGFKTLNIDFSNKYPSMKNGVYVVRCYIDNKIYEGVSNVGRHPSIAKLNRPILEIHLLDIDIDLYDKDCKVEFLKFLREEKEFKDILELKQAINKNILETKEYFKNEK